MRSRPLVGLCAAYAAGILLARGLDFAFVILALTAAGLAVIGAVRRRSVLLSAAGLVLAAWFGALSFTRGEVYASLGVKDSRGLDA